MKKLAIICCVVNLCLLTSTAFGQAEKKIGKHVTLMESVDQLIIQLPKNKVEVKEIKGSRILIEIQITLSSGNLQLLDYLTNAGRYEVAAKLNQGKEALLITKAAKNNNIIIQKGKEIHEDISYVIYVPSNQLNNIHIDDVATMGFADLSND
ncbi:MAG: hypothetical protein GY810_17510 [Aureispira sp.]|nr:hypothetical protein [Aureispira sp.]